MHGNDHPPFGHLAIGVVIGPIKSRQTLFNLGRADMAIGRDDGSVIQLHHQRRIILAPVWVNHQSAEIRRDHWASQRLTQGLRHAKRAHIIGDVAPHILGADAKTAT